MFRPAASDPKAYRSWVFEGPWLNPDEMLKGFIEDLSTQPTRRVQKRSPFDLEGTIGAFNRAYDFPLAIETFNLPYAPAGAGRWSLEGTRAVAGLNEIGDGLVFSHHITDPAYGRACSAFDLVRMHRFSGEDELVRSGTPVNKLPSQEAMLELASCDARVMAEVVGVEFSAELQNEWRLGLRLKPKDGTPLDLHRELGPHRRE